MFLDRIPYLLVYSRLVLGFVLIALSGFNTDLNRKIIVFIMIWAIVSDIFDGIIARKLNVSTEKLRRLDSSIDQIFWILALAGVYFISPQFYEENFAKILIILILEGLTYLVSYLRFKKEVATHAILSKFWALTIVATLIQVVLTGNSDLIFNICFYLGVITRIEIIAILLVIKEWANDIPSLYHAIQLRKGIPIKRNKLFNG